MDLTRLTDKTYMAELAAKNKMLNSDPAFIAGRTSYLEKLVPIIQKQLRDTATWQMPEDISVNESVALCLAINISEAFKNPVLQFLSIQPWLQAWVLRKWRMEQYIGQTIGLIV